MSSCTKQAVLLDEGTCSDNEIYENGSLNNENVENRTETLDSVPSNIVNLCYKFELVYLRQETLCNTPVPNEVWRGGSQQCTRACPELESS